MKKIYTLDSITQGKVGEENIFIGTAKNEGNGPILELKDGALQLLGMSPWSHAKEGKSVLLHGKLREATSSQATINSNKFALEAPTEIKPK